MVNISIARKDKIEEFLLLKLMFRSNISLLVNMYIVQVNVVKMWIPLGYE